MIPYFSAETSADVKSQGADIAVIPVGSYEQHGDFLPLATDSIVAGLIAQRLATDYNLFLLPPVTIACSHEHSGFPGTVSISASTLTVLIADVRESLRAQGIDKLVIVNGHGGNYFLSNVVVQANVSDRCMTLFPTRQDWDQARKDSGCVSNHSEDMHAGELEVSLLLHADPGLVRAGYQETDHIPGPRPFLLVTGMKEYTESGVIGLPSEGSAKRGKLSSTVLRNHFLRTLTCSRMASGTA